MDTIENTQIATEYITAAGAPFEEIQDSLLTVNKNLIQTQLFFSRTISQYVKLLNEAGKKGDLDRVSSLVKSLQYFVVQVETFVNVQKEVAPGVDYCQTSVLIPQVFKETESLLAQNSLLVVDHTDIDYPNLPIFFQDFKELLRQVLLIILKFSENGSEVFPIRFHYELSPLHHVFQFRCTTLELDLDELLDYLNHPEQYSPLVIFEKIGLELSIIRDICKKQKVLFEIVEEAGIYAFTLGFRRDDIR